MKPTPLVQPTTPEHTGTRIAAGSKVSNIHLVNKSINPGHTGTRIAAGSKVSNVSSGGLNTSPEGSSTYIPTLSNSSSRSVLRCLFSGAVSSLDAFSFSPLSRGCPAMPCQTTGKLEATDPRSSRTKGSFPSGTKAPPWKSTTPGSRRCKPSSRSLLIGEQPHPWQLMHHQDRESRHRSSKPPGRYELLLATTQLSPG